MLKARVIIFKYSNDMINYLKLYCYNLISIFFTIFFSIFLTMFNFLELDYFP